MNKRWTVVPATALLLAIGACGSGGAGGSSDEVLIGGIHPRTGPASYYGLPMDRGVELAISEINAAGGIKVGDSSVRLKYQAEDDKSDPTAGVAAFKKLTTDGADFVVGPLGGAVVHALKPIVESSDSLLLIDGAADPSPGLLDPPGMFRWPPSSASIDASLISVIGDQGFDSLAILNDEANPSFASSVDEVVQGVENGGAKVLSTKNFATGDSDFRAQLTSILGGEHPDAIVVRGYALESAQATEQARKLGFDGRVLWEVLAPPETIKSAVSAKSMEGVIDVVYATPDLYEKLDNARVIEFSKAYRAKFGEEPGSLSAFSYDVIHTLAAAIKDAGSTDPAAVTEALGKLKLDDVDLVNAYEAYGGGALFDESGQAKVVPTGMVWKDGDWFPLEGEAP